nr:GGDEF domain-containing protein [Parahaliea mediterranea]
MWFPTRDGIVKVHTDRIQRNPHPPRLRIDRARFDGQWRAAGRHQPLRLASDQRDLDIGFTALSFQDPGSVRMEYRLQGYQDAWQPLDDPLRRVAYYTNLPPGELRFEIRGSNNVGVWSPEPATLPIHIAPRWYETAVARGLAGAGTLLALAAAFRLNTRRMASREKQLSRLVAERTEELRVANTHLREYSRQLKTTSLTDPLTGLWNRRYFNEHIVPELRAFQQRQLAGHGAPGSCMLVALLDIDLFKRINDQFGHDGGDQILTRFADCLRALVHPRDHVLRWGGEEFMIVFQALPEGEMTGIAQRIIRSLRQRSFFLDSGREVKLTCSVGLSRFPPARGDGEAGAWEQAVALADKALYQVKHSGRDDWCLVETRAPLANRLDDDLETLEAAGLVRIRRGGPAPAA